MTRQDFELIAKVIRDWVPDVAMPQWMANDQRHAIAADMADALARTSPRFDRDRFITAATGGN